MCRVAKIHLEQARKLPNDPAVAGKWLLSQKGVSLVLESGRITQEGILRLPNRQPAGWVQPYLLAGMRYNRRSK